MPQKMLLINGSLRQGSFNQASLDYIGQGLRKAGLQVEQLDYSQVPFFNQDTEFPAPDSVRAMREQVSQAAALWIASPKYNGSIPGHLKVALDWLSRPIEQGQTGAPDLIKDKLVALTGKAGPHGAAEVLQELTKLLKRMKLRVLEGNQPSLVIPTEAWTTGVMVLDDQQKADLDQKMTAFLAALEN